MGQALSGLESTWTGGGADAASARFKPAIEATNTASQAFNGNASQVTNTAHSFENLKSQLTPIEDQSPERSTWDTLTPWDTDSEDKINQYKAQLEQNRQAYQAYEQNVNATAGNMRTDYGKLGDGGFGDFTIDGSGKTGGDDENSSGVMTFDESGSQSDAAGGQQSSPVGSPQSINTQSATGPNGPGNSSSYTPDLPGPSTGPSAGDDSTQTSSYTAPAASTSNYQGPGYNATTGFGSNSGGNSSYTPQGYGSSSGTLGFGAVGGSTGSGGLGAGAGTGSGSGSGSGSAGARLTGGGPGGAGALGAGKGTGTGAPGPGGQAASTGASRGSSAGGAAVRGGMGAMGGAGAGKGKGADDEEHQRRYVQDSDDAFSLTEGEDVLRDPDTGNVVTPPTIGD